MSSDFPPRSTFVRNQVPRTTCSISEIGLTGDDSDALDFSIVDDEPPRFVVASSSYEIVEKIGCGGMGKVYRARDMDLERDVALKILRRGLSPKDSIADQFTNEARIIGSLQHPGVAQVYECGQTYDGRPFHTMKLVEGNTLLDKIKERAFEFGNANNLLNVFSNVCQTMAYTHSRSIIHLDLKPNNIMVGSFGEVHVMDWGLAQELPGSANGKPNQKQSGLDVFGNPKHVRGTPQYMSYEQANGRPLDKRSDVFSLGAILCELLTGIPPYDASGRKELMEQARKADLGEAIDRLLDCDVDIPLARLAVKCLSKNPDDRPADAGELVKEINLFFDSVNKQVEDDMTRFFELSLDLFCIAGTDGYFRRLNKNFSKVLGYSESVLLATPFLDFVVEEDRDKTIAIVQQLDEGIPVVRFRNRYRTRTGSVIEFEWTAKSLPDENLIFAVARSVQ